MLKKNSYVQIAIAAIISIALFVGVSIIGSFSLSMKIILGTIIYFSGSFYFFKSNLLKNKVLGLLIIILPVLLSLIFFNILQFKATWISMPSQAFLILAVACSFVYHKNNWLAVPIILACLVFVWVGWLNKYYIYKYTYNTITGNVSFKLPQPSLYDSSGAIYPLVQKDKYYIVDFWETSCLYCYKEFPFIDSISKSADKLRYEIITLNIPIRKESKEDNYNALNKFHYSFKKLYAENISTADSFGVSGYPTTIVIKNQQVIFRGDFEDAVKRFDVAP